MANINTPFTTQDGFSSTTSTVDRIVFGNGSQQTTAWTGTVAASNVTDLASVATSGAYSDLSGTPTLAAVATSGAYSDLSGTPTALSSFTNDVGFITSASAVTSITAGTGTHVDSSTGAVTIWTDGGGGGTGFVYVTAAETTATSSSTGIVLISDNGNHVAYYNSTVSNWLYVANDAFVYTPPPPPSGPPVTDYIAWYDTSSFSSGTWTDLSGNGYDATSGGSPSVNSISGGGSSITSAITGGTSDTITWPMNMPTDFTLFHVTRYTGSNQQRIYQLYQPGSWGWLFGHHANKSGVAYYGGAITSWADHFGSNWVISTSQNNPNPGLYRGNAVNYSLTGSQTVGSGDPLNINSKSDESSDWATVECIIYDRLLDSGEIASTQAYLAARYGISI